MSDENMLDKFNLDPELIKLEPFCIEDRRYLHQIPEASGQEFKTAKYCSDILKNLGYQLSFYDGHTGFIADLIVDEGFDMVGIRADMDALVMPDLTNDEFTSQHEGIAHNCGHDTHMAIVLTVARYCIEQKQNLKHNVRFLFQMAEENAYVPGANLMVELGCMNGVSEVYALHNIGSLDYGHIDVRQGAMSSFGHAWNLKVEGISAHASTPQKGLDAIREVTRLIAEMDHIVAKKTDPFSPAVFVCGVINGGTVQNAVADLATAAGTIRSMDHETDKILQDSFAFLEKESCARGYKTSFDHAGYPAIINHPTAYERIVKAANQAIPTQYINANCQPMTGCEDFSYMVNGTIDQKGAMFFLGTGNEEKGIKNYIHSNPYYVEEGALIIGAQVFINLLTN